jgi:uncharacterized membrane protein YdfJ with MMPL/SSD domain
LPTPHLILLARWCAGRPHGPLIAWLLFLPAAAVSGLLVVLRDPTVAVAPSSPGNGSLLAVGAPLMVVLLLLVLGSVRLTALAVAYITAVTVAAAGLLLTLSAIAPGSFRALDLVLLPAVTGSANHLLFALRRCQEIPPGGSDVQDTAQIIASTAGRTALITSAAIFSAMAGLYLTGDPRLMRMAADVIVVVLVETAATLTLLPVLLPRTTIPSRGLFRRRCLPALTARLMASEHRRGAVGIVVSLALTVAAFGYFVWRDLALPQLPGPAPLPLVLLIGLTVLALTVVFRPMVVAVTTAVLAALSALVALSVLACVDMPKPAWAPVFLLMVLAGPATDMHVCLLQHFRSEALTGMAPHHVLAEGLRRGMVAISGAALVTVGGFSALGLAGTGALSAIGWSAAAALLVDVLVIRLVLLPLLLSLAGPVHWWQRAPAPSWFRARSRPANRDSR